MCKWCNRPLKEQQVCQNGGYLSCPECSRHCGRHAYQQREQFGERMMTPGGEVRSQSWCKKCRSKPGTGSPERLC